jgi:hypothetical protein
MWVKTDPDLRPVFHKKDETSMAHLHSGLLVCRVVNTVRFQLKKKVIMENKEKLEPLSFQWKEIVRIMNTQKAVTALAQNKSDKIIMIRRCSYPYDKAKMIYDRLGYKYLPFKMKKSVVHKSIFEKKLS